MDTKRRFFTFKAAPAVRRAIEAEVALSGRTMSAVAEAIIIAGLRARGHALPKDVQECGKDQVRTRRDLVEATA